VSRPVKHSFTIAGHRTSVSLEDPFWQALREIAAARAGAGACRVVWSGARVLVSLMGRHYAGGADASRLPSRPRPGR
jgi:hypothetical protein